MAERARCRNCNAILARDNTDTACGPCASRAVRDGAARIPSARFWDRPALRAAIKEQHVGRLFRAYRQAHTPTIPQQTLAEWLQLTQGHLSIIERQRRPITDLERLERWCNALHVPARLRWFRGPTANAASISEDAVGLNDTVTVRLPEGGASVFLSRRELLTALGVGIAGGAAYARFEHALDSLTTGPDALRLFEDAYSRYQSAARSVAPQSLMDGMLGNVAILDGLRRRASGSNRQTIGRLQARYAESLSWLSEEAGDISGALYWVDRASQWAQGAQWHSMSAYGFVRRSMMAISFTSDGRRAVDNARTVLDLADASPRLQGLAAKQGAFGHALLGDKDSSDRALDEAMDLLSRPVREDDAVLGQRSVVNEDLFVVFRATCDVYLGHGDYAIHALRPRLASLSTSSTRTATITRAKLAHAYAHAGQPQEAARLANQALIDVERVGSLSARSELQRAVPVLQRWDRRDDVRTVVARLSAAIV